MKLAGSGIPLGIPALQPKILQYVCQKRNKMASNITLRESVSSMERSALQNIQVKLMGHRTKLLEEFRKKDTLNNGVISLSAWVECVEGVVGLSLPWRQLARRVTHVSDDNKVRYNEMFQVNFMGPGHHNHQSNQSSSSSSSSSSLPRTSSFSGNRNAANDEGSDKQDAVIEMLYQNRECLETIFRLMDKDNSGKLSFEEFENGCRLMNKHIGSPLSAETIHNMALSMDANRDGQIDFNEFLEGIRLVTKFGKERESDAPSEEYSVIIE